MAIFYIRGDPYEQNFDPMRVGTNHGGGPLGAILDIRGGGLMTKISTLGGWGLITVGTPWGPFWTLGWILITKISTLGGWDQSPLVQLMACRLVGAKPLPETTVGTP